MVYPTDHHLVYIKQAVDYDDPRPPFGRAPPSRGWHVISINSLFYIINRMINHGVKDPTHGVIIYGRLFRE